MVLSGVVRMSVMGWDMWRWVIRIGQVMRELCVVIVLMMVRNVLVLLKGRWRGWDAMGRPFERTCNLNIKGGACDGGCRDATKGGANTGKIRIHSDALRCF